MEWRVNCWLKKTPPAEFALFNAPSRTEKSRKVSDCWCSVALDFAHPCHAQTPTSWINMDSEPHLVSTTCGQTEISTVDQMHDNGRLLLHVIWVQALKPALSKSLISEILPKLRFHHWIHALVIFFKEAIFVLFSILPQFAEKPVCGWFWFCRGQTSRPVAKEQECKKPNPKQWFSWAFWLVSGLWLEAIGCFSN